MFLLIWNEKKCIIIYGWNHKILAIVLFCTYYVLHSIVTKRQCTGQKLLIYYKSSKKVNLLPKKWCQISWNIHYIHILKYKNLKIWKHKKTCEMAWQVIKWIFAVEPFVGNQCLNQFISLVPNLLKYSWHSFTKI